MTTMSAHELEEYDLKQLDKLGPATLKVAARMHDAGIPLARTIESQMRTFARALDDRKAEMLKQAEDCDAGRLITRLFEHSQITGEPIDDDQLDELIMQKMRAAEYLMFLERSNYFQTWQELIYQKVRGLKEYIRVLDQIIYLNNRRPGIGAAPGSVAAADKDFRLYEQRIDLSPLPDQYRWPDVMVDRWNLVIEFLNNLPEQIDAEWKKPKPVEEEKPTRHLSEASHQAARQKLAEMIRR